MNIPFIRLVPNNLMISLNVSINFLQGFTIAKLRDIYIKLH
jgi:hypothetical protein